MERIGDTPPPRTVPRQDATYILNHRVPDSGLEFKEDYVHDRHGLGSDMDERGGRERGMGGRPDKRRWDSCRWAFGRRYDDVCRMITYQLYLALHSLNSYESSSRNAAHAVCFCTLKGTYNRRNACRTYLIAVLRALSPGLQARPLTGPPRPGTRDE